MSRDSFFDWFRPLPHRQKRTARRRPGRSIGVPPIHEVRRRDLARCQLERLEERTLLAVTATIDANDDAVIDGTSGPDTVTMSIENQGLANETLRITDLAGVTAGTGFTQDGPNSATVLTSAILGLDIFIRTWDDTDAVQIQATPAGIVTHVDVGAGADIVNVSSDAPANTGTLDDINGTLAIDGAADANTINVSSSGSILSDTVTIAGGSISGTASGGWSIQQSSTGSNTINLFLGSDADLVKVNGTSAGETFNIDAGDGADTVSFSDGVTLRGGIVNGGLADDTIDYSAYTSPIAVNLGSTVSSLTASLTGLQETPPNLSTPTGTAQLTYDSTNKTFDISMNVSGLDSTLVTGFHLHRAAFGTAGPIIVDFGLGGFTPDGSGGFDFLAAGVPLSALHEAAFLGGVTYLNIHTAALPGGIIRGQVFANALFTPGAGTATGTGGVSSIENAIGGSGSFSIGSSVFGDSIVGDANPNVLNGGPGNDVIVGARGGDSITGDANNDILVWNNGDGSDIMNGGSGSDMTVVNGSVTGPDHFRINPGAGGRLDFQRVAPSIPFSLDIGSTETLNVAGIGGDDNFIVNSLAGVSGLSAINLHGDAGTDSFDITPTASVTIFVDGLQPTLPAQPGDNLVYQGSGTVTAVGPIPGSGSIAQSGFGNVNFRNMESFQSTSSSTIVIDASADPGGNNGAGNGVADTFRIVRNGANLEVYINGDLAQVVNYASVGSIDVNGSGDNDELTVDHSGGLLDRFIDYDAGGQTGGVGDALRITGTPAGGFGGTARETYRVGTTQDAGVWELNVSGATGAAAFNTGEMFIDFTGLEPASSDSVVPTFDVIMNALSNRATLQNNCSSPPAGFASPRLEVVDNNGTFETFCFANKTAVRLMGQSGDDSFRLNANANALGLTHLHIYGHVAPDVVGQPVDDLGQDRFEINATLSGVTTDLHGQGGSDLFHNSDIGPFSSGTETLENLAGDLNLYGGESASDSDLIVLQDFNDATADSVTITSSAIAGAAPVAINYFDAEGLFFESTLLADVIDIASTQLGTNYLVTGGGGDDTVTIGNESSDFNTTFDGTLDNILGSVVIAGDYSLASSNVDTLNIDDSGTNSLSGTASIETVAGFSFSMGPFATARAGNATALMNFAPAPIRYFHEDFTPISGNRVEFLNIITSAGDDTINVLATTATIRTRMDAFTGDDSNTITIDGDDLSANNLFLGNSGTDRFVLDIDGNLGATGVFPLTSLEIRGDDPTGSSSRDSLDVLDDSASARDLVFDFQDAAGAVDIEPRAGGSGGLGVGAEDIPILVRSMETLNYRGGPGNNDQVLVEGTSGNDDLTIAPLSASSALVFIGGNPWDGPTDIESFENALPGMSDGGLGPDIQLRGLATTSLTVDGSAGSNNRLFVYGTSEANLSNLSAIDPFDPAGIGNGFGFGPGVVIPGSSNGARPGGTLPNASDDVLVSDAQVRFVNDAQAPTADLLIRVNIVTGSFNDANSLDDDLIVNTGSEACVAGVADDIVASLSANATFGIQINGGDPTAPCAPDGDHLSVFTAAEVNIYSDKMATPTVSITSGGSGQIGFSSIEQALFTPGNGVVNLIGDNNDPSADQTDNFVVYGADVDGDASDGGVGEFSLRINGDTASPANPALFFDNVQFLNAFGESLNPDQTEPSGDVDTLEVTPYADNTPRGWGIQVTFDESDPSQADGGQSDLLIYNTVGAHPVSERIIVQPSGAEAGELRVTNAGFGTPIVTISYTNNLDIVINDSDGFESDTDSLVLRGTNPDGGATSGRESLLADFSAAGTVADPMVIVADANPVNAAEPLLYRLRSLSNFNSISFELLGGNDDIGIIGRTDGSLTVNVDSGLGSDAITALGASGANDQFGFVPGASVDAGTVAVARAGAASTSIHFTGTESLNFNGGGGEGQDSVRVEGNNADNNFLLAASAGQTPGGVITIDVAPQINFFNLGVDNRGPSSDIMMLGLDGDDTFAVEHEAGWQIASVQISGGTPASADADSVLLTASSSAASDDTVAYTASGPNSGFVDVTAAGATTNYSITSVSTLHVDAFSETTADRLNVTTPHAVIVPGASPGTGRVEPTDISGATLLPLHYSAFETVLVTGNAAVIQGTATDDMVVIDSAGVVRLQNLLGFSNAVDVSAFTRLVVNSLGGNDQVRVESSNLFSGGITIVGGDSDAASDEVIASCMSCGPTIDVASGWLGGIVAGAINLQGVESLTIQGQDAFDNHFTIRNYAAASGLRRITIDGGDFDQDDGDTLGVFTAAGINDVFYMPTGSTTAQLSRTSADPTIELTGFSNVAGHIGIVFNGNADALHFLGSNLADLITLEQAGFGIRMSSEVRGSDWVPIDVIGAEGLSVFGDLGDDVVTIDETNGLVSLDSGITYDGGSGHDSLRLVNNAAQPQVVDAVYNVGPSHNSGSIIHSVGAEGQAVFFTDLEPVFDFVPGPLTVNATNDSNAISYTMGSGGRNFGLVAIDGFETIEFTSKTQLDIFARGGADTVSLNNSATPTGLSLINVHGGDPADGDSLLVFGTTASESIAYQPTGLGSGSITITGLPSTQFVAVELLTVDGGGGGDRLSVSTENINGSQTLTPGSAFDSGRVEFHNNSLAGFLGVPMQFAGLGSGGSLSFTDTARFDNLTYYGTNANDTFNVSAAGQVTLNSRIPVNTPSIITLTLLGLDGDDTFDVPGNHNLPGVVSTPDIPGMVIQGGGPSASDILNFDGAGTSSVHVTLNDPFSTVREGANGLIQFTGIEILNVDADNNMTVITERSNETVVVTPTSTNGGTLQVDGFAPRMNWTDSATFTVVMTGGSDTMVVNANQAANTVDVTGTFVRVDAIESINYFFASLTGALAVYGLGENDTFNVTPSATVPIFIDGGDPIGLLPGDRINLAGPATLNAGPEGDEGSLETAGNRPVSFDHIESLTITGQGSGLPSVINATGGADAISIVARDSSTHAGTDGVQDFTVTLNGGAEILYVNTPAIMIHSLGGSDEIAVQAPSPNPAGPWNVDLVLNGGLPSASDSVLFGSPRANTLTFTPTGSDSGVLDVIDLSSVTTLIGIEHLVYDGEGGGDQITVVGTQGADIFVHTPAAVDEGTVRVNTMLTLGYQNLGTDANLTARGEGGTDSLVSHGTESNDVFSVAAGTGTVDLAGSPGDYVNVIPNSIEHLVLEGLDGDDRFNIAGPQGYTTIALVGGSPSASDVADITGDGASAVSASLGNNDGSASVTGGGLGTINLSGIELLNLDAAGQDLTAITTAVDDSVVVTPLGIDSGELSANQKSPLLAFTNSDTFTLSLGLGSNTLVVQGTSSSDDVTATSAAVSIAGRETVNYTGVSALVILGREGDDFLDIDNTSGLLTYSGGTTFDGGPGLDTLRLSGNQSIDFSSYSVGPEESAGAIAHFAGEVSQHVYFTNLEPVIDIVPGPLVVNATNASNAINYTQGPNSGGFLVGGNVSASVSIDGFETIEFANKTTLTIRAAAGSDTIHLNNPTSPTGLTGDCDSIASGSQPICVDGGDPTASDLLIINGVPGTADAIRVTPTGTGSGVVTSLSGATNVSFVTTEHLTVVGQTPDGDSIRFANTAGDDTFEFTRGVTPDSGLVTGFVRGALNFSFVPVQFVGFAGLFNGIADSVGGPGAGNDTVIFNGTSADDIISYGPPVIGLDASVIVNGSTPMLVQDGVNTVVLRGLEGNDTFRVDFTVPDDDVTRVVRVEGGDSDSSSDILNYIATSGAATTIDLGVTTIFQTAPAANPVVFTGVEVIHETSSGLGSALTIVGTAGPDALDYTPTGATAGTVLQGGANLTIHFSGVNAAFAIDAVGGADVITVHGTSMSDGPAVADDIEVVRGTTTTVAVRSFKTVSLPASTTEALVVQAGLGDDTIQVSGGGGPALTVDGGGPTASDTLTITLATAGGPATVVSPGSTPDSGVVIDAQDGNVAFQGIELIGLTGAAATDDVTFQGTHDNDTIALQFLGGANRVWVNDRAVVSFGNFDTATLTGRFGDDKFNVHPAGLVGLTGDCDTVAPGTQSICVTGGDSTDADQIVINGSTLLNTITFAPTAPDAATISVASAPAVTVLSTELVTINGLGGNDTLDVALPPAGNSTVVLTPGATSDSGSVRVDSLVPMEFINAGAAGRLTVTDTSNTDLDRLIYHGTIASDIFTVPHAVVPAPSIALNAQIGVGTTAVEHYSLRGLAGDDTFNITAQTAVHISVEGDDPGASDILNFNSTGNVTIDLANATIDDDASTGSPDVSYSGIETLNADLNNGDLVVEATSEDDDLTVTLHNATSGRIERGHTVQQNGQVQPPVLAPAVNYTDTQTDADRLLIDLMGGQDTLVVVGNAWAQSIDIAVPAGIVTIDDMPNGVGNDGLVRWINGESLSVFGLEGDDVFNVSAGSIPVFLDGGDPIGVTAGDRFVVDGAGALVVVEPGPESDEGGIVVGSNARISFDHIESGQVTGADCALVVGTNGDDDITIIARSQLSNPTQFVGANGIQDFTTVVNGGTEILWLDTENLYIDALSGDDDVVLRTRAPNNAHWDVNVRIVGGPPSAATGDQGDVIEVETPGNIADDVVYTATGSETATLLLDTNNNGIYDPLGNDTLIQILAEFVIDCDGDNVNEYRSSPGGSEAVIYDGESGNDSFEVVGTAGTDTIVHIPGTGTDEGSFRVNNLLGVSYQNLGAAGTILVNGLGQAGAEADRLIAHGTAASDTFDVAANSGAVTVNGHIALTPIAIERLVMNGYDGDDRFVVQSGSPIYPAGIEIQAGDPSGSDHVTLHGTAGPDTIDLSLASAGDIASGVVGTPVLLVHVENLTINSLGGNDTLSVTGLGGVSDLDHVTFNSGGDSLDTMSITGTADPDLVTVTPTSATSVTASANGLGPIVVTNLSAAASSTYTISGAANADTIVVIGTSMNDTIQVNRDTNATVTVLGLKTVTVPTANNEQLVVNSGLGDDTINVSDGAGPAIPITVDGGLPTASDTLTVDNFVSGTTTVAPGSTPDSGVVTTPDGTVSFLGIEFVNVNATAASDALVALGTNDTDQIALARLLGGDRIWVNDRAVITYTAFESVTLQGRFGTDQFSVSPIGLLGLLDDCDANSANGIQSICVSGGDPTTADRLIVNGNSSTNTINVFPDSPDSGRVSITGSPAIAFTTTESVHINGQDGNDLLTVTSPSDSQFVQYTPGVKADEGSIDVGLTVPVTFNNLGGSAILTLADSGSARTDSLLYNGTQNNESFAVSTTGAVTLSNHIAVNTPGISSMTLSGLDGDDSFTVTGPLPAGLSTITLSGGNPSSSDVANLNGDGSAATLTLGSAPPDTIDAILTGGGLATINLTSIEFANVNTAGGNLTVNTDQAPSATQDDDTLHVTPLGSNSGRLQANDRSPLVNYSNTGTMTVDLGGGADHLIVHGSSVAESIVATPAVVTVGSREPVNYLNTEALSIDAHQGSDTITVTSSATTAIFVDGGDPIGVLPGDVLNVVANGPVVFYAGPEVDEGGFQVGANQPISFNHIETITVAPPGAGPGLGVIVFASNADDDITIIARDGSTHVGADGVQDFTVTVNTLPEVLFVNQPILVVEALSGDDDITLRAPAPNDAVWDVDVTIVGGPSSAANERMGDSLVVETPYAGSETVQFTPTSSETGTMALVDLSSVITIANTAFCAAPAPAICPPSLPPTIVIGGNGGIERLTYDGEADNDVVHVIGSAAPDTIVHTPSDATDAGSFRVNSFLSLNYQNLGNGATVSVSGGAAADTLVALGTAGSDTMTALATSGNVDLLSFRGNHLDLVRGPDIEQLQLDGFEGDDTFVINLSQPYQQILVNGGGPGGSDTLAVNGASAVTEAFVLTPNTVPGKGLVEVNALDTPYTGIEHIFLDGNSAATDSLLIRDDNRDNTWDVSAGTAGDLVQIDGRESIDYSDFADVELVNLSGTDLFRIKPTNLVGFSNEFRATGDGGVLVDDVVQLIGTPGDDDVFAAAVPGNIVEVNGVEITIGSGLIEVFVTTLEGEDTINLSLSLQGMRKVVDAGRDDDDVNMRGTLDAIIFGGDGDDVIVGTPIADSIYGGRGDDTIDGFGGNDLILGEADNDLITGGTGDDRLHGGDGSDVFIWSLGDGDDTVEGGGDEADILRFTGGALAETYNLFANLTDPSRTALTRDDGVATDTQDIAGVEQIDINAGSGADVIIVGRANDDLPGGQLVSPADPTATLNDLTTTHVQVVNLSLGQGDAAGDEVYVDGRPADDNIFVSGSGPIQNRVVTVAGLSADIKLLQANSLFDRLTVRGNEGEDTIKAAAGVENVVRIRLDGGAGDDFLSADATILGGAGDDYLEGGPGVDELCGHAGNDTLFGGNDLADDLYDGGTEFDTILVHGTQPNSAERINLRQNNFAFTFITVCDSVVTEVTSLDYEILDVRTGALYVSETETIVTEFGFGSTVEEVRIVAAAGADIIQLATADALFDNPGYSLRMTVVGGDDNTQDRLAVVDDGIDDLVLYRQSGLTGAGTVTVGPSNLEPFQIQFEQIEIVQFIDEFGNQINDAGIQNPPPGLTTSRLVVFKHDPFEYNDDRFTATHLGANQTINLDPTIDPGSAPGQGSFGLPLFADKDYYQIEAEFTGTLDLQVFFEEIGTLPSGRPGLPNNGNLDIQLLDADGTIIATSNFLGDNERIRVPAVEGQIYYLRVIGANNAINVYDVTIINHKPPVPFDIELDDFPLLQPFSPFEVCTQEQIGLPDPNENSDSGRSQFDNVTCDRTPTIRFRIDDAVLLQDIQGNDNTPAGFPNNPPDRLIPIPFNPSTSYNRVNLAPGYRIAIFEEGVPQQPEVFPYGEPQIPVGFAQPVPGVAGVYEFTFPPTLINTCTDPRTGGVMTVNGLCDGSHFIWARIQMIDPSDNDLNAATQTREVGYGDRSLSLEIVVDAIDPVVVFGDPNQFNDGLDAASDSGVTPQNGTFVDEITNDTTPTFWGWAEANSVVRIWLDLNNNGVVDLIDANGDSIPDTGSDRLLATTVAVPQDGTNQFPNGFWIATSSVDMNDPSLNVGVDGRRRILATAEDLAGNISTAANLEIFIDTQGPQVTDVRFDPIDPNEPLRSVFNPKPLENSPTPLTATIRIDVRDLPNRFVQNPAVGGGDGPSGFQHPALNQTLAVQPGNYQLVGDQWGIIPIQSINFVSTSTAAGAPATGYVELNFDMPLPDDRYTLTMFDRIKDDAGNALDGESNTQEPTDTPDLPSGDGEGGDSFIARFTVDSRPEIGTFCCGSWYIDLNGNGTFDDPNNHDTDFTNGDIVFKFGLPGDFPVVGDWNNDGFDEIGVYGRRADGFRFELDLNGNGTFDSKDISFLFNATGIGAGGRPVAGRWNQNQKGDHVAVFNGTTWFVDFDTDPYTSGPPNVAPAVIDTTDRGRPIAADFNGDGDDDAGLFQSTTNTFVLDFASDDNFQADTTIVFGFNTSGQLAVAADWDADGDGNIGLFVQDRNGQFPREAAEWYLDLGKPFTGPLSGYLRQQFDDGVLNFKPADPGDGHFEPPPTGGLNTDPNLRFVFQDIFYQFGDELSEPIVGNFDPPVGDAPVGTPIVRPDERLDDANTIGPNATPLIVWDEAGDASDAGTIASSSDRDMFRFTATESGKIAIDAKKRGSNLDTYLAVYNSTGKRIARNANISKRNTDSHVELSVVAGQSYYIEVSGSKRTTGAYEISLDYLLATAAMVAETPDSKGGGAPSGGSSTSGSAGSSAVTDDHGNSTATATSLPLPGTESVRTAGNIARGDVDFFELRPSVNGRFELNVAAFNSTLNSAVDIYHSSGRLIATNDDRGNMSSDSRVTIDVNAGESYFVRVRGSGNRTGNYAMTIDWLLAQGL